MLSAEAHSFRRNSRLAISLSWIGGYTNIVVLAATVHTVSHQTGNTTNLGKALADWLLSAGEWGAIATCVYLLAAFLLGAAASALSSEYAHRRNRRGHYTLPLAMEVVALSIAAICIELHPSVAIDPNAFLNYAVTGTASFAMGLQNATITRISRAVVRTTHVTGVLTDIGLDGVQLLLWFRDRLHSRGRHRLQRIVLTAQRQPAFLRLALLVSIFGSFLTGVVIGSYIWVQWTQFALLPPVLFLGMIIFLDLRTPVGEIHPVNPAAIRDIRSLSSQQQAIGPQVGIYQISSGARPQSHRAPHFQYWVSQLPPECKVVILMLNPYTQFDSNSMADLKQAIYQLRASNRQLILEGASNQQYDFMHRTKVILRIRRANICNDLPTAICRAAEIL